MPSINCRFVYLLNIMQQIILIFWVAKDEAEQSKERLIENAVLN